MKNDHHRPRLVSFAAGILTFILAAFISPEIAAAQTRIISLSGNLDFGRVPIRASAQRTLTISNTGDSVLTVSNLDLPAVPGIEVIDIEGNWSGQIAPGASQDVVITFTPVGIFNTGTNDLDFVGYISVESDATDGTNVIALTGVGTWPPATSVLSLSTNNLDFGSLPIGGINELQLWLTNSGTLPVTITNIAFPDGFRSTYFAPLTIAAGGVADIFVLFNPTNVAAHGGIATIYSDSTGPIVFPGSNNTNSPGMNQFTVSGTGTYPSGQFIGLFAPTNDDTFENSGYFTANSTAKGKFRGTITLANKRYPFSAPVSPSGAVAATIVRKKLGNLNVSLQFDVEDSGSRWTGAVDGGSWSADVRMELAVLLPKNTHRPFPPGTYPITIEITNVVLNPVLNPPPEGAATLATKTNGATRVSGILGDGTKFSQNTILCGEGVPFYAPLYRGRGAILGWINLESMQPFPPLPPPHVLPSAILPPITNPPVFTTYRIIGTLNWFKPAGIDPDYPDGFSLQPLVHLSFH